MDREAARRMLAALRRGDKKAVAEYLRYKALECEVVCEHCRDRMRPGAREFDFEELTVSFDCSLCGKRNRVAIGKWNITPLQVPPIS